jgi:hypothetical protein
LFKINQEIDKKLIFLGGLMKNIIALSFLLFFLMGCLSGIDKTPSNKTTKSMLNVKCDGQAVGASQSRDRFSAVSVPVGYSCVVVKQTRTCLASGLWTDWSGPDNLSCAMEFCQRNYVETRNMFNAPRVPFGSNCVSESQTRTCQADGLSWSSWSGTAGFIYSSCYVNTANAPTIITQPNAQTTVAEGSAVTLSVVASSASRLTYQWKKDGQTLAGKTAKDLIFNSVNISDAGRYVVLVTSDGQSVTSNEAVLTVDAIPRMPVADPQFSPNGGTLVSGQTVTISSATENAIIYYTLDGSIPNCSGVGNSYTSAISYAAMAASTNKIIKAIACQSGIPNSTVAISAVYTIQTIVPISCPNGFILVPGNAALGTQDFCVMKFEAKDDGASKPISRPAGTPWICLTANAATAKCQSLGAKYNIISNPEWMTIARNIENVASNWSAGAVGNGMIPRGHSDMDPAGVLAVTNESDLYNGTNNNAGQPLESGWEQKRTHTLSNGQIIWDLSGNADEWVSWTSAASFTLSPSCTVDIQYFFELSEVVCSELRAQDYLPSHGNYDSSMGMGMFSAAPGNQAATRGRAWGSPDGLSGIFALELFANATQSVGCNYLSFRCVYHL